MLNKKKAEFIEELNQRVEDKILNKANADFLAKLIEKAEDLEEVQSIMALGTTYKRTGFHFDYRKEPTCSNIKYLKKNEELSFVTDKNALTHKLIIGDNYDALRQLLITHRGLIDVIYIDPPYGKDNMGKFADTNYSNAITRDNLLSMLYIRLQLARELLSNNGVIFCSIDDKNMAYVKCLMDDIFCESGFITTFSWIASSRKYDSFTDDELIKVLGANLGAFKSGHEYVLCYRKTKEFTFALRKTEDSIIESRITKNGNAVSVLKLPKGLKMHSNITKTFKGFVGGDSEKIEILNPEGAVFENGILMNDIELKGPYASAGLVKKFLTSEEDVFDNRGQKITEVYFTDTCLPYIVKEKKGELPTNVLSGYGDTSNTKKMLNTILSSDLFDYAKPIQLVKDLVGLHSNKNAIVLDFFAGSGTTGQAVLELNKEDGGNRKFIVCTNNEETDSTPNGIAYDVTAKRLRRVMVGSCYNGDNSFKWNENNTPYGDNLQVTEITEISPTVSAKGKTPFDVIDETLYDNLPFDKKEDKINWICTYFQNTMKSVESDEKYCERWGE